MDFDSAKKKKIPFREVSSLKGILEGILLLFS